MSEPLHMILANASLMHRKTVRQKFQELNLSEGQPKVLASLLENEGIVQKELATICCVEPATMTSLLQKMQQDGYIEKIQKSVSGGKRANCIYLTDSGREFAQKSIQIMDDAQVQAFKDFSPEEKDTFLDLIDRLTRNLSD